MLFMSVFLPCLPTGRSNTGSFAASLPAPPVWQGSQSRRRAVRPATRVHAHYRRRSDGKRGKSFTDGWLPAGHLRHAHSVAVRDAARQMAEAGCAKFANL